MNNQNQTFMSKIIFIQGKLRQYRSFRKILLTNKNPVFPLSRPGETIKRGILTSRASNGVAGLGKGRAKKPSNFKISLFKKNIFLFFFSTSECFSIMVHLFFFCIQVGEIDGTYIAKESEKLLAMGDLYLDSVLKPTKSLYRIIQECVEFHQKALRFRVRRIKKDVK